MKILNWRKIALAKNLLITYLHFTFSVVSDKEKAFGQASK